MNTCPVNSHNEWDPLEEVIVGDLTNATIPSGPGAAICDAPHLAARLQPLFAGIRYPKFVLRNAEQELEGFIALLEAEGVMVRRPDPQPFARTFSTPHWSAQGYSCAAPRDVLLIVGDEIIEAPMSWRSRYFEAFAYRRLLQSYAETGARVTAAPKPELRDELYNPHFGRDGDDGWAVTEAEPVFDAADFVRCGRTILAIRSNTANAAGIAWLARHLPEHRIVQIPLRNAHAMHIDHHVMPLAPGRLLVNPQWVAIEQLPELLPEWEILPAPLADESDNRLARFSDACSRWLNMNVLSLDEKRIIVERDQVSMINALRLGFRAHPLRVSALLDVRRGVSLRHAGCAAKERSEYLTHYRVRVSPQRAQRATEMVESSPRSALRTRRDEKRLFGASPTRSIANLQERNAHRLFTQWPSVFSVVKLVLLRRSSVSGRARSRNGCARRYNLSMQSKAATVDEYLASLPDDRREALEQVRAVILKNLDKNCEEGMQYGMIGYYIPHSVYPAGYHCDPKQPLPFAGMASQKNHMSLYLMCVYGSEQQKQAFVDAWIASGKKFTKSTMGKACIRFKKIDDLPLDVIGKTIKAMTAKRYIAHYEASIKSPSSR